jgi:hypothetical protein
MAIITKGDQDGVYGVTNAMKIVKVGQVVQLIGEYERYTRSQIQG